jgi:hypothetical protein
MRTIMTVVPELSWGQAFDYAMRSGHIVNLVFGTIALGLFVFLITRSGGKKKASQPESIIEKYRVVISAPFFMAAVAFVLVKPGNIQWNNAHELSNEQAKYYQEKSPDYSTYWDSLYDANRMIGAAKK